MPYATNNATNGGLTNTAIYAPTISINSSSVLGFSSSSCRLYIPCVQLNANDQEAYQQLLTSGHRKIIEYTVSDVFQFANNISINQSNVNTQITNSSICPIRVWILTNSTLASNLSNQASFKSMFPGGNNGYCQFNNVNLAINNANFYINNLISMYEVYQLANELVPDVIQQVSTVGSTVGYIDYINGALPLVFDISRFTQANVNAPLTINFIAASTNAIAADLTCIIEKIQTLVLTYSVNGISFQVSQGRVIV